MGKYDYFSGQAVPGSGSFLPPREDKENDVPVVLVTLRITEGPRAGEEETYRGRLTDKGAEYVVQDLRTMGWKCNDITKLEGLGDTKVTIAISHDQGNNGKVYRNVKVFEPRAKQKMSDEDRASFASRFAALAASTAPVSVGAHNQPTDLPAKKEPVQAPPAASGDDIPF